MRRGRRGERGIALLLVLWVFMILGVLALDFARYMRDDAMAAVNLADETRGYYIALAGLNHAIFDELEARSDVAGSAAAGSADRHGPARRDAMGRKEKRHQGDEASAADDVEESDTCVGPADGQWHDGEFAGGRYSVRMTDEGGRISVNKVDEALLSRVVTNLLRGGNATTGVDRRTKTAIDTVVDSILDWRDTDNLARLHGAENDYYLGRRSPYRAKNSFLDSPDELLLVRGVTPTLFYGAEGMPGLRDIFSVYTRREARVHLKTAPAAVLQVLLDVDAASAADLVAQRDDDPETFATTVLGQLQAVDPALAQTAIDTGGCPSVVTIDARADISEERNQSRVAAVVDLGSEGGEEVRIIRWIDRAPWDAALPPAPGAES